MRPFELVRLPTLPEAQKQMTEDPVHRAFRAGGTPRWVSSSATSPRATTSFAPTGPTDAIVGLHPGDRMAGIECLLIDRQTRLRDFKQLLRRN